MNRTIAPEYIQPNKLNLQFPEEIALTDAVKLFWIKDVKNDSVKLDIEWSAGSKYQEKKLTANFTNKLLLSGTEEKSSKEISSEIDYFGGYLQHEIDRDHAGISLYGLAPNMGDIFDVFADALANCQFREDEFEKERSVALNRYHIETQKVKTRCRRRFNQAVFGEASDYGQLAEEPDFEAISREDLMAFHKSFYLEAAPTIFLVGNVDQSFINQLQAWALTLGQDKPVYESKGLRQEKGRIDVPVENAIQSAVRLGRLMFDKKHPDYFKFQLLNTVLGGYFGSRLMTNIREDKGYTYGIGSSMAVMEHGAYFFIATEVGVEVKEDTLLEIEQELKRLREEPIPEEELMRVKNYMLGDFLRNANGPIAMMENFKNIHFNKLSTSYYTDFIQAINWATANELMVLANKYLKTEEMVVVTAG